MIYDHNYPRYRQMWLGSGANRYNGAFYYSKEIVQNIIPRIKTNRNWITIDIGQVDANHSIVFIHNNLNPHRYDWLFDYRDKILVCGIPETCEKMDYLGTPIYLPLSVDVEAVAKYRTKKTRDVAFIGRPDKQHDGYLPAGIDYVMGVQRAKFLSEVAKYRKVYAVGRAAVEAKILGCEILPYDPRFPDPERWKIMDNKDAAKILQRKLDEIDGRQKHDH